MASILLRCLYTLLASALLFYRGHGLERLRIGDSLFAARAGDELVSPNGTFSAGFINVGKNAFCFSTWFTHSTGNKTVVWMANRDQPVTEQGSQIRLIKYGRVVLISGRDGNIWEADTNSRRDGKTLELLDTGNLVLRNGTGAVVWESFSSPTDTLLPNQQMTRSTALISNKAAGSYLSGFYSFKFNDDNVLYLTYNGPEFSTIYWPVQDRAVYIQGRTNFNSSRLAAIDEMGVFSSSDLLHFNVSNYGKGGRRLTLDHDGVLRVYSLTDSKWEIVWFLDIGVCNVHGLCGTYGVCIYTPEPTCACPRGFVRKDLSDWSKGCVPKINLTGAARVGWLKLPHTDYYGYDLDTYAKGVSFENCSETCRTDSRCKGFGFRNKFCYPKYVLRNGRSMPDAKNTFYIKVSATTSATERDGPLLAPSELSGTGGIIDTSSGKPPKDRAKNVYLRYLVGFVGAVGAVELVFILLGFWFVRKTTPMGPMKTGYRLQQEMGFRRFSYKELKKATMNFSEEIGRGGFGCVYKGLLADGETEVAVKRLEGVTQGDAEFWAEVSVIGRINHMNLLRVCGFCAEEKHRLLVYEYMENGSLDRVLFSSDSEGEVFDWGQRYTVALGTAMGLAYLHEECLEWVLHCDVKPQNILLDSSFRPKLADFGMSKLAEYGAGGKESRQGKLEVSRARGTRGYMAPEWLANQEITAKVDVYSYGVVLLELVTGKSGSDVHGEKRNQILIRWVQDKVNARNGVGKAAKELVDPMLQGNYNAAQVELLLDVGLLCVKMSKDERPAMSTVVGLLLGDDKQINTPGRTTPQDKNL